MRAFAALLLVGSIAWMSPCPAVATGTSRTTTLQMRVLYRSDGNLFTGVQTDGARFAVANRPAGPVLQDDGGSWRSLGLGSGCRVGQPRVGAVLALCGGAQVALVRLAGSRGVTPVLGLMPADLVSEIGRYWLAGNRQRDGRFTRLYVNRRTGMQVERPYLQPLLDLDRPALGGRMPALARGNVLLARSDSRVAIERSRSILLRRGGRSMVVRRHCQATCTSVRYGAGWVSWAEGVTVWAFRVADQRSFRWSPSAAQVKTYALHRAPLVQHTRTRIYASFTRRDASSAAIPGGTDFTARLTARRQ
jgi:hypothetical protein